MNAEFFPSWTQALGWTLLNSLWQAMIVLLLVVIGLRFTPSRLSQVRYIIACTGMAFIVVMNAATFVYLFGQSPTETAAININNIVAGSAAATSPGRSAGDWVMSVIGIVASNMPLIILCWAAGAFFFALRMVSAWWYVSKLRTESFVIDDVWNDRLQTLARQLGINRAITLAQSARIHSPMVIGCLKPIVLVPMGMLAGLPAEQIETIFIHELAHIRRHDYIINLVQSFVETIFFFNPFVWIISGIIRREREFCCDDTVIAKHGSALVYARALTQLEEARLTKAAFALSLAENKNQLLNRIKRIMEKSAKNYSGRDRLIPAALLVVGLICASWLTITSEPEQHNREAANQAADTVIKKNEKSASYSRRSIITYDEKGQPHEEVVESYDGDEDMREAMMPLMSFDFAVPPMPGEPTIPPMFPDMSGFEPPVPLSFDLRIDTIPGGFHYRHDQDWKEFSEAFEKKFRERFSDFYQSNEKDFEKMMKELEENFKNDFGDNWQAHHDLMIADMGHEEVMKKMEQSIQQMEEQAHRAQERAREQSDVWVERQRDQAERMEREAHRHAERAEAMEQEAKRMEADMHVFEDELSEALRKDGYLGKDEHLETINWSDEGLNVNGKSIKKSDLKKYSELRKKYLKGNTYWYVE
ncbi:hypothetical protein KK083_27865 [Fulvivirgaceae bacterium PWU4]|uniref:Peptidase M56 domain-containing protein n=1 Tax=Chryseosolibacter histidini TaxID=2782349 RepID=A0AAP2DU95_9BACT|nr:M56 family metallopeptidase [Chryseosolibacter histidini]MBT1700739.1 hypothetical protein [Chryseosolibacter histidini]